MVYLILLHGRETPDEDMEEMGYASDLFGPYESIRVNYGAEISCAQPADKLGRAVYDLFKLEDGLVEYQGDYFGDFEVQSEDVAHRPEDATYPPQQRWERTVQSMSDMLDNIMET